MATLVQINDLVVGTLDLQQRFNAARLQNAWSILGENSGSPTAPRLAWANKIFANYAADDGKEYRHFLSHPDIQANGLQTNDYQVIQAVKSFIDVWAAGP